MQKINILLVDDHKLLRDSWTFILNSDARFHVLGDIHTGMGAVELAGILRPEIVLMDINMTPLDGFETTRLLLQKFPDTRVIGLSMHCMPAYAKRMFQLGAMGYITKNSSREEMFTAILEVHYGKKYVCEEVKNILSRQKLETGNVFQDLEALSRKESEIIKHLREGKSSKQIAAELRISCKTVEVHRYNMLKKLKLKNTAALVNFANLNGV